VCVKLINHMPIPGMDILHMYSIPRPIPTISYNLAKYPPPLKKTKKTATLSEIEFRFLSARRRACVVGARRGARRDHLLTAPGGGRSSVALESVPFAAQQVTRRLRRALLSLVIIELALTRFSQ